MQIFGLFAAAASPPAAAAHRTFEISVKCRLWEKMLESLLRSGRGTRTAEEVAVHTKKFLFVVQTTNGSKKSFIHSVRCSCCCKRGDVRLAIVGVSHAF